MPVLRHGRCFRMNGRHPAVYATPVDFGLFLFVSYLLVILRSYGNKYGGFQMEEKWEEKRKNPSLMQNKVKKEESNRD